MLPFPAFSDNFCNFKIVIKKSDKLNLVTDCYIDVIYVDDHQHWLVNQMFLKYIFKKTQNTYFLLNESLFT